MKWREVTESETERERDIGEIERVRVGEIAGNKWLVMEAHLLNGDTPH